MKQLLTALVVGFMLTGCGHQSSTNVPQQAPGQEGGKTHLLDKDAGGPDVGDPDAGVSGPAPLHGQ